MNEDVILKMASEERLHESAIHQLADMFTNIFGIGVWDDSVEETARRVLRFWEEFRPADDLEFNLTTFPANKIGDQLIVVNDIEFSSICAHHLLPFLGVAHVGYIPHSKMVGLSKIPRVVDHFARRPQTQERLTAQIASFLKEQLDAKGVAVVIRSTHTCMACRGVRKHNGQMTTSQVKGVFLTAPAARQEFLSLIGGGV